MPAKELFGALALFVVAIARAAKALMRPISISPIIPITGLLSDQGEKSINFYFIMVPLRKESIKVWYSKAQIKPKPCIARHVHVL